MDWVDKIATGSLIEAVVAGARPSIVLDEAQIGVPYKNGVKIRPFFDSWGDLRFCTEDDILIDHSTDQRMMWLREVGEYIEADSPLLDLFSDFVGNLSELCHRVRYG
jgi:hypothetical protein